MGTTAVIGAFIGGIVACALAATALFGWMRGRDRKRGALAAATMRAENEHRNAVAESVAATERARAAIRAADATAESAASPSATVGDYLASHGVRVRDE